MSLQQLTHEEIEHLSMIELAAKVLIEENKAMNYKEIFDKIAEFKNFTEEQKQNMMAQFYTDMNVDGRFLTLGSGMWGLKRWYPVEQAEEEITEEPKKKTKKKKKKKETVAEDFDDDLDVTDDEIDEIVTDLGDDLDEDDFDDEIDEDLEEIEDDVDELEAEENLDDAEDDDLR